MDNCHDLTLNLILSKNYYIMIIYNMDLVGSEYASSGGEVNSVDMLKSGTSFVAHDLENTKDYAGSYAPIVKGVHQCGGRKKRNSRKQKKSRRKNKTQQKRRKNKSQKKKKRKYKKNKRGGDSCSLKGGSDFSKGAGSMVS